MAESYGAATYAAGAGLDALATLAQAIQAGKRASAVARYNQQVTMANAQAAAQAAEAEAVQAERARAIALQDAYLAEQAGIYQEARTREQQARILADTRAIVASSGLLLEGSPLRVYEDTARNTERDILMQRYQATLAQRAALERATQADYAAALSRYGGQERLRVGRQQAGLVRAQEDTSYVLAGMTRAGAGLLQAGAQYQLLRERERGGSLTPTQPWTTPRPLLLG